MIRGVCLGLVAKRADIDPGRANRIKAGTRTDKGRGCKAHERETYMKNGQFRATEPVGPGTRGLALFDEVTP